MPLSSVYAATPRIKNPFAIIHKELQLGKIKEILSRIKIKV